MDKILATIKLCTEFIIASNLFFQVTAHDKDLAELTPTIIRNMFFVLIFEFVFYWQILR